MATEYDPSEFVDNDFQSARKATATIAQASPPLVGHSSRAPTREEVEAKVNDMQTKLAELRRAQQELEQERSDLEETRRRQSEFTRGRQEMQQHLTRSSARVLAICSASRRAANSAFSSRPMPRDALGKVESIQEEAWTRDNLQTELTRAL